MSAESIDMDVLLSTVAAGSSSLYDDSEFRRRCAIGSILTLFALFTVTGNGLVMAAVVCEPCLRATITNYFVVSLAVADLIIGSVVMPFGIVLEATGGWWPFGVDWCDVWHSFDVLASTASILNLSVIALDRYWAITDPIAYPGRMSTARAFVFIGLVWILSAAISFPAIVWWRHSAAVSTSTLLSSEAAGESSTNRVQSLHELITAVMTTATTTLDSCQFTEDSGYLIFSSLVSFYGPVTVILFAYYRIYSAAAAQLRSLERGSKVMTTANDGVSLSNGAAAGAGVLTLRIHRGGRCNGTNAITAAYGRSRSMVPASSDHISDIATSGSSSTSRRSREISLQRSPCTTTSLLHQHHNNSGVGIDDVRHTSPPSLSASTATSTRRRWNTLTVCRRRLGRVARERKAAKTLGIVMGVFCACWVPFFVTNLLYGVCRHIGCVRNADTLFSIFTWLGYANSGMNPVIYACSMRDFRRAFGRLLCRRACRQSPQGLLAAGGHGVALYRRSTGGVSVTHPLQRRAMLAAGRGLADSEYSSTSFIY